MDNSDFLNDLSQSDTLFDLVVAEDSDLPGGVRILEPKDLDQGLKDAFPERMGAFRTPGIPRLLQKTAARVARIMAIRAKDRFDVSSAGLQHAWFFPVYSELTTLVPIRHFARLLAKDVGKTPIAIRLPSLAFTALDYWNANACEPLYLAHELRRRGVPVFLLLAEQPDPTKLSFVLSGKWLPKGYPRYFRHPEWSAVLSKNFIRRPEQVSERHKTQKRERPGLILRWAQARERRKACRFDLELVRGHLAGGFRTFSLRRDAMSLDRAFVDLVGPMTTQVAEWYRAELAGKPVQAVHVADHASLEAGLLCAEVARQGGKSFIWPHSANVVNLHAHDPVNVARVTMAARSTAMHWAQAVGLDKVTVDAATILPETPPVPSFDDHQPVHIVLFAGAHFLRRMPLVSHAAHLATWNRALDALQAADVQLVVKHKSSWETREWISGHSSNPAGLRFSNVHANKLRLPNMLFASVSLTSTAIFEGIARGVPGFVIRDAPIEETPYYDPDVIPWVSSDQPGAFLSGLTLASARTALLERQTEWFRQETDWGNGRAETLL